MGTKDIPPRYHPQFAYAQLTQPKLQTDNGGQPSDPTGFSDPSSREKALYRTQADPTIPLSLPAHSSVNDSPFKAFTYT